MPNADINHKKDFDCRIVMCYSKRCFIVSALFGAVEHGHLDKARTILESTDVDVNRCAANSITHFHTPPPFSFRKKFLLLEN